MDLIDQIQHQVADLRRVAENELAKVKELEQKVSVLRKIQFVTIPMAAEILDVTPRTIQNYIAAGKLTPYSKNGSIKMDNRKTPVRIDINELYKMC